jgi:hypothetical protein
MAALDPAILAWALTLPSSNRWRGLAEAFAAGTTRVSFDGRPVEYRRFNDRQPIQTRGQDYPHRRWITLWMTGQCQAQTNAASRTSITMPHFSARQQTPGIAYLFRLFGAFYRADLLTD